jgi:hypothetical protein
MAEKYGLGGKSYVLLVRLKPRRVRGCGASWIRVGRMLISPRDRPGLEHNWSDQVVFASVAAGFPDAVAIDADLEKIADDWM